MKNWIKKVFFTGALTGTLAVFSLPLQADSQRLSDEDDEGGNPNSDIHGFVDLVFKNDYITPRGLLVTDTGLTAQLLMGIVLDVYKNPDCMINDISLSFGCWNDIWSEQDSHYAADWNELDWFVGASFKIDKSWKFTAIFTQFLSPPGNFRPENNGEFTLYYDDSKWGWPVVINPYVRAWWAISGDSTVVVGKRGNTYYVEFGMTPTLDLTDNCYLPITLSAPTWISVGPANFWDGSDLARKGKHSNWGVFSTGLKGKIPLKFVPKRLGSWYIDAGVQYYDLINDNLLEAQIYTLGLSSYKHAHRNVVVGYGGFGFEF